MQECYQGVRSVLEQEIFGERARSVSMNESKTPDKLDIKTEHRRRSEEMSMTSLSLKVETRCSSGPKSPESGDDAKL